MNIQIHDWSIDLTSRGVGMKEGRDMSAELVAEAEETTPAVILRRR
jgi:hypothetical protein|tara:strand:- start:368 stop:505 length:138 start_codon:yes stop_codon:yes gene_type:complete